MIEKTIIEFAGSHRNRDGIFINKFKNEPHPQNRPHWIFSYNRTGNTFKNPFWNLHNLLRPARTSLGSGGDLRSIYAAKQARRLKECSTPAGVGP